MRSIRLVVLFAAGSAASPAHGAAAQTGAPGTAARQRAMTTAPRGIRELRAHFLPPPLTGAWVAATDEGLVELSFDARSATTVSRLERAPGTREFYAPDDVLDWITGVGALLQWVAHGPDDATPPQPVLGHGDGNRLELRGSVREGRRTLTIASLGCRVGGSQGSDIDPLAIANAVGQFRRAALEARQVRPRHAPDDALWYGHAVGCPANRISGAAPAWPDDVAASLGPHEELAQFVVGPMGGVEQGSEQFLPSADPRFAAAVRRALRSWRFLPATRAGRPVRELVHYTFQFTPPVIMERGGKRCTARTLGAPTRCDSLFTAFIGNDLVSIVPQGNGTIRIANIDEADAGYLPANGLPGTAPHTRVSLPASEFRRWLDTVVTLYPTIAVDSMRARLPNQEYAQAAPIIGTVDGPGLNLWLSSTGWIRAGFSCGRPGSGQARFFEVEPRHLSAFRRIAEAALVRVPLQPRWRPGGKRPFPGHELTCDVEPIVPLRDPVLSGSAVGQASREVMAGFVVDTSGQVEPSSIELLPGIDSTVRRLVTGALEQWVFHPAIAEGRLVRAQEYVTVVLRAPDGDAVVLAAASDSGRRASGSGHTIFFRPPPEPAPSPLATSREAWRRAIAEMQPLVERARRTWPSVRQRYAAGLRLGSRLYVTARLTDILGGMEQVSVLVDSISRGTIHGRIESPVRTVIGWHRDDEAAVDETDLIDWMIVAADGSVEGDIVGRYLAAYRPSQPTLPPAPPRTVPAAKSASAVFDSITEANHPVQPAWQGRIRYGGGPSVGAPRSDYTGEAPPARWCLRATARASGDFGTSGRSWIDISRHWLREVLSDTTSHGDGWRAVLGGAPVIQPSDSIVQIFDEKQCRQIAQVLNRDLLGWKVGPPPVVILRVRDYLIAFPSNAPMGEFGLAVGMDLRRVIRGVATW